MDEIGAQQRLLLELFDWSGSEVSEDSANGSEGRIGRTAEESQQLGGIALNSGDYQAAIDHFKRAVQQDRESEEAAINLAAAFDTADQAPEAYRQYQKALANGPTKEALLGLSDMLRRFGHNQEAIEKLRESIELEPKNSHLRYKLAEHLRNRGYPKAAAEAIQAAIALAADNAFLHYWHGDLLIDLGRYEEALDAFKAAVELAPAEDYYYELTAIAFWGAGKQQEAVRAIRLASDLDSENPLYYGLLATFLAQMGLPEEAKQEQERAKTMDDYDRDKLKTLLERAHRERR